MNKSINLRKLTEDDIEQVRIWRNTISINKNFIDRAIISKENQHNWFKNINPQLEKYYIADYKNQSMGLFYATKIDYEKKECEPNGFIGISKFINTPIAGIALLSFFKFLFTELGMLKLKGKIMKHNHSFIELHKQLNADIITSENPELLKVELTKESFQEFIDRYHII